MTDSTPADAGHQEHQPRASGRPDAAGPGPHGPAGRGQLAWPAAMVLSGIISVQAGAGIADKLFSEIPPAAVTGLRLWTSAVAMAVISGRGMARSGIISVQAGAGIADKLFSEIPPAAVTGLRLWTSAVAMAVISGRGMA